VVGHRVKAGRERVNKKNKRPHYDPSALMRLRDLMRGCPCDYWREKRWFVRIFYCIKSYVEKKNNTITETRTTFFQNFPTLSGNTKLKKVEAEGKVRKSWLAIVFGPSIWYKNVQGFHQVKTRAHTASPRTSLREFEGLSPHSSSLPQPQSPKSSQPSQVSDRYFFGD
jgi:hypothetical protein